MPQNTTRSIQQDHGSLWKQPRRIPALPIARLAPTLIAVLILVELSFAFVNQNNVAHAAERQRIDQSAPSVQAANGSETIGSAITTPDCSTVDMMHKHAIVIPNKYVTINGNVIMVVIKNVKVGEKLEVEVEVESHSHLHQK
jgi:hypothetical protein